MPTFQSDAAGGLALDAGPWIVPGADPVSEVVISWTSAELEGRETLYFGLTPGELLPVPVESNGHIRRSRLTGLSGGTDYFYSIEGSEGPVQSFTTLSDAPGLRFAVYGDMQWTNEISKIGNEIMASALAAADADMYVQLGDLAENGGSLKNWVSVLRYIEHFAGTAPIAPLPGNHDYYGDRDIGNFKSLFPCNFAGDNGGYYSFDLGDVHFLFLDNFDGALHLRTSDEQERWAEEDLRSAADRGIKWKFVFFHHAVLTTGTSWHDTDLQRWLIPLADRYEVDAVFFGHDHHYEHWIYEYGWDSLVYDPDDRPAGRPIHYFCSGGGGARAEIHYGLLVHPTRRMKLDLYDANTMEKAPMTIKREAWNRDLFIDHTDDPAFGQPLDGKHYYHLPSVQSYFSGNEHFGYQYGEQTLHYIIVEIPAENPDICRISVHYPNGAIVSGPGGSIPQSWELRK
jgi:hypothetical protein